MKKFNLQKVIAALFACFCSTYAFSQANQSLSNLTSPTSINQTLLPNSDATKNLGSTTASWKDGYFDGRGYFLGGLNVGGSSTTNGIQLDPNSTGKVSEFRFMELTSNGTNYVGFKAPDNITTSKVWTLPAADGTNGQVLMTNGSGSMLWGTVTGGGGGTSVTANFVPRSDGTNLITGTIRDSSNKVSIGSSISQKGKLTVYRNSGAGIGEGESAIQGLGNNSILGTQYSIGYMGAVNINELLGQTLNPPFNASLDHAGVLGYLKDPNSEGAGVIGYNKSNAGLTYGVYGLSLGTGTFNYGSYNKAAGVTGAFGINTGAYGEATNGITNYGLWGHANATSTGSVNSYGIYGSASGINGSVYAGYFQGKVHITNQLQVADSIRTYDALVLGNENRPSAFEFAVTGGADAYIDDVLSVHTTTATASLNVKGTNETVLVEGTTPYIKLTDGTNPSSFLQASGNELRIGTLSGNTSGKLIFRFNGVSKNGMDVNGRLGLGTTSPSALLHLKGSNELIRLEGTDAYIDFLSGTIQKAFIQRSGDNLKIACNSGSIIFGNNVTGDQLFILPDGRIGVGTSTPKSGYKLSVEGKVACRELKVETVSWPDYVFENDFNRMSISEVESYINTHKHLPGIPSEAEVISEGLDLGAMQVKMMEKIEEMMLYIIDLKKENEKLNDEIVTLKNN